MNNDAFLRRLERTLRRIEIDQTEIVEMLGEVRSHLEETGETPLDAFGEPEQYAIQRTGVDPETLHIPIWPRVAAIALWWLAGSTALTAVWSPGRSGAVVAWNAALAVVAAAGGLWLWHRHRPLLPTGSRLRRFEMSTTRRACVVVGLAATTAALGYTLIPYQADGIDCGYAWAEVSSDPGPCLTAAQDRARVAIISAIGVAFVAASAFTLAGSPRTPRVTNGPHH